MSLKHLPEPSGSGNLFASLAAHAVAWWGERPLFQLALLLSVGAVIWLLADNMADNMHRLGLTPGFAFLDRSAGFEIGESWIAYSGHDTFGRAILVGLLNTIQVGLLGCLFATLLGVILGISRLSSNPLLSTSVQAYVEVVRNTPLLLQLFVWTLAVQALPSPRQALTPLPGVFLTNRGVYIPAVEGFWPAVAAAVLTTTLIFRLLKRRRWLAVPAGLVALTAVQQAFGGTASIPELDGFNVEGGQSLTPEFAALLTGLVVNSSASIAETVRGGILAVPAGQWEAARALGLSHGQVLRYVVLPQALRVIVPVMTSAYVSLIKHSSIAVAIGYPDLVNILNTTANQSGQVLEAIIVMIAVYLGLSLATSLGMNFYNHRIALKGGLHR